MDYEKAYKEALERAKNIYGASENEDILHTLETLFPELKRNEYESTRKRIIALVNAHGQGKFKESMLAWLEKLKVFTEHDDGLYYFVNREFTYVGSPIWDNDSWLEKQDEQKPAEWTEEDESMYTRTLGILGKCYMGQLPTKVEDELNWLKYRLKSIRPHKQWKPSKEQIRTLEYYMHNLVCSEHKEVLFGLYEQLKKLSE